MDYHRIYREFIKDRREREPGLSGYTERHHILPRSLGGGDEPENLIRLTAEDHYFAHLLLAKMHGGRMASAVMLLVQCCNGPMGDRLRLRRKYAAARLITARMLAEEWAKDKNPLFNGECYEWVNYRTGKEEYATLYDMHQRYGASRGSWTAVASGTRPSIKGWLLKSRLATHSRSEKGKTFSFVNRDGRSFTGTQVAFCGAHGVNAASASRIIRQGSVTVCGWRRAGVADRVANAPKDGRRGASLGTGRKYYLRHRDGRTFAGTAEDFRIMMRKPVTLSMSVRLSGLLRGAAPTLYGWAIDREKQPDAIRAQH